jgi:hypothetical protein
MESKLLPLLSLLPCAHCGETSVMATDEPTSEGWSHIQCRNPQCGSAMSKHQPLADTIAAWNRRADHIPDAEKMVWIDCTKEMPPERMEVLVLGQWSDGGRFITCGDWMGNQWDLDFQPKDATITHWRMLPEMPAAPAGVK